MTPLLIVDGHHLLYRACYGFATRITSLDGTRDITGIFGFVALVRKSSLLLAQAGGPHEIVVVFDGKNGASSRAARDSGYKAARGSDPVPFLSLPAVKTALDTVAVRWVELDDREADDIIATLAYQAAAGSTSVTCYSGDRDLYQLLDLPGSSVLTPQHAVIGAADIVRRYGVRPIQWPDYRALTGDPSDNIAGVPGIGPKTAAKLLADADHLEDVPALHGPAEASRRRLGIWLEQALIWRDMIRLDSDVALPDGLIGVTPTRPIPLARDVIASMDLW